MLSSHLCVVDFVCSTTAVPAVRVKSAESTGRILFCMKVGVEYTQSKGQTDSKMTN